MGDDLEKDDRDPFVDLNTTVSNILTHLGLDEWGKPIPEHHEPAPPAVTREYVEGGLKIWTVAPLRKLARSWLVLEASNAYLSVRVERLNEENARLRAVAEAAETHLEICGSSPDYRLKSALRRLKEGE